MFMVHENFKDVFCEILKTTYRGPSYRMVKVRWWNIGFSDNPWLIDGRPQTIKILESDWSRWSFFNPENPSSHPGRR